jgi:nicotinamide-nucleotide amidase
VTGPAEPEEPTSPGAPAAPGPPGAPGAPAAPGVPGVPGVPAAPGAPGTGWPPVGPAWPAPEPPAPAGAPLGAGAPAAPSATPAEVVALLRGRGETVAVAESLTGGLLTAALTEPPGASAAVRGGLVVYATDLKAQLAGVPVPLLDAEGPVSPDVAGALAAGARDRLGATYGLGVTGVAGPDPQGGRPVGTVHLGLAGPDGGRVRTLALAGDRAAIRAATVAAALALLAGVLRAGAPESTG